MLPANIRLMCKSVRGSSLFFFACNGQEMGAGSKQGWLLFEPANESQKRFAPPLIVEVCHHIREQPQWPFDRHRPFIQEPTLLDLDLQFFRIVKESGREIRWVVHPARGD